MRKIECQECGSHTDARADYCQVCYSELHYDASTRETGLKRLGGVLVSGGALGGMFFLGHWMLVTGSLLVLLTGIAGLTLGFLIE